MCVCVCVCYFVTFYFKCVFHTDTLYNVLSVCQYKIHNDMCVHIYKFVGVHVCVFV